MRLNEFQAHVVRDTTPAQGMIELIIVGQIEKHIADQMAALAKTAHQIGSDLDTICTEYVKAKEAVRGDDPRNVTLAKPA